MRKQRPRGTTTRDGIVDAALVLADEHGVDGVKIRSVAERVGAPAMSLYTHFANKGELLDLMYTEVSRRLYVDSGQPTWQAELSAVCHNLKDVLSQHPRWAELLSRPGAPSAAAVRERVLRMMVATGFSVDDAFRAFSSTVLTAVGLALARITMKGTQGESTISKRFEQVKAMLATAPPGRDAVTQAALSKLDRFDFDASFSFVIRTLIRGVEAQQGLAEDPGSGRAAPG